MAKPSIDLIRALRNTAGKLERSSDYQWGHMGSCNCGFLAREVTKLNKHEIHERAMHRHGDWNEQLNDYCPTSGWPMDDLISELLKAGLSIDDLKHLERLSDPTILGHVPSGKKYLRHNHKADVVEYLAAWAGMLENEMAETIRLKEIMDLEETVHV
ncbi:MAG: hypothetical protein MI975_26820 [Cytophagales bacterium]|nr:hypothetical protein [Cytophagales bacterium]